jgi:hypothetical protein
MIDIVIKAIPKGEMRYPTVGDWWFDGEQLHIRVTDDVPENEQFTVALHELVEVWLCKNRGITQEAVDDFDIRGPGAEYCSENGIEPGDHPDAPYRREHRFAMLIEHLMAHELGLVGYGVIR